MKGLGNGHTQYTGHAPMAICHCHVQLEMVYDIVLIVFIKIILRAKKP